MRNRPSDDDNFDVTRPNRGRVPPPPPQGPPIRTIGLGVFALIVILTFAFGSPFTIRNSFEGVVSRFGQARYWVPPGLHWKIPIIDSVAKIDMREQSNPEDMEATTKDPMPVKVKLSQTWRVKPGMSMDFFVRYTDKARFESVILDRKFREAAKEAISQAPALQLLTGRQAVSYDIDKRMAKELENYPAEVLSTQIEDVDPPVEYRQAVVAKERAREDAGREAFVLAQFKLKAEQETVTKEAQAKGVEAMAAADASRVRQMGQAEAEALEKVGAAIAKNPLLIQHEYAKKWGGVMPYLMPSDKVPMLMQMPTPAR